MGLENITPPHKVGDDHWSSEFLLSVDGVNEAEQEETLLIANAVDVLGFGVIEVVSVTVGHDSRDIVIFALLLGGVGGNIEGDVFRVCTTRQKLPIIVTPGVDEDRWHP